MLRFQLFILELFFLSRSKQEAELFQYLCWFRFDSTRKVKSVVKKKKKKLKTSPSFLEREM